MENTKGTLELKFKLQDSSGHISCVGSVTGFSIAVVSQYALTLSCIFPIATPDYINNFATVAYKAVLPLNLYPDFGSVPLQIGSEF